MTHDVPNSQTESHFQFPWYVTVILYPVILVVSVVDKVKTCVKGKK